MANFLRDKFIKNISVDEKALREINNVFINKLNEINETILSKSNNNETQDDTLFLTYIVRFDQNGYRLFNFDEVLKYFNSANSLERIVFSLETAISVKTSRAIGSFAELTLDSNNPNNCYLVVSSEYENHVLSFFSRLSETIEKFQNKNKWIRNNWTKFLIQIFGIVLGFAISLWAATLISPFFVIENPFIISFIFILLLFSNLWGYIYKQLTSVVNNSFPSLKFVRKNKGKLHWLAQTIIGGVVLAFTLFLLSKVFELIGSIIGSLIKIA